MKIAGNTEAGRADAMVPTLLQASAGLADRDPAVVDRSLKDIANLMKPVLIPGNSWLKLIARIMDDTQRGGIFSELPILQQMEAPAPDFTISYVDGNSFTLSEALGKPTAIISAI